MILWPSVNSFRYISFSKVVSLRTWNWNHFSKDVSLKPLQNDLPKTVVLVVWWSYGLGEITRASDILLFLGLFPIDHNIYYIFRKLFPLDQCRICKLNRLRLESRLVFYNIGIEFTSHLSFYTSSAFLNTISGSWKCLGSCRSYAMSMEVDDLWNIFNKWMDCCQLIPMSVLSNRQIALI